VFGYSLIIDMSARDCRRAGQWIYSKGQDTYAPFGPCIVTADDIPDPQTLDLNLSVNGVKKQDSNTRYMLFTVAALIADLSVGITLEPGDITLQERRLASERDALRRSGSGRETLLRRRCRRSATCVILSWPSNRADPAKIHGCRRSSRAGIPEHGCNG